MSTHDNQVGNHHQEPVITITDPNAGFEVDKPEKLPQLRMHDLPEDAKGLSPEELALVPTLTEPVGDAKSDSDQEPSDSTDLEEQPLAQELLPQADSWVEVCQMRIASLSDDIHSLNERLDRLEKRIKA